MPTFGTPVYAGRSSGSTGLPVPSPAGMTAGDLVVVALRAQESNGTIPWSPPAGPWVRVSPDPVLPSANARVGEIWVKPVTDPALEPAQYLFTGPGARAVAISVACTVESPGTVARVGSPGYGGAPSTGGVATIGAHNLTSAPALSLVAIGSEQTEGNSRVPVVTPAGFTVIGNGQSSLDQSTTGTRTALWLGYRSEPDTAMESITAQYQNGSAVGMYLGTFTGGAPVAPEEPEEIPDGFRSVAQMLSVPGATWAHRGGSVSWPEHTELAYRNSALAGYGALEFSCARTSDGVWFGLHDADINYTSETTGLPPASQMTWAEVQAYKVTRNSGGNPQPYWKMTDFLDTYAQTHVCILDYKVAWQHKDEWYSLLASYGARQRIVVKQWGKTNDGPDIQARASALGFSTWGYFYEADALDGTMAANQQFFTILGMDYGASQAAWDIALSFGKPVVGHIAPTAAAYATAIAKGARMVQCSGVAVIPARGVPAVARPWDAVYAQGSRIPVSQINLGAIQVWP